MPRLGPAGCLLFVAACTAKPGPEPGPTAGAPTAEEWAALDRFGATWVTHRPEGIEAAAEAVVQAIAAEPLVVAHGVGDNGFGAAAVFASGALSGALLRDDFGGVTPEQAERVEAWIASLQDANPAARRARSPRPDRAALPPPDHSPASHQVLFVSAASAQASGSDLTAFERFKQRMIDEYCFEDADFTVRSNRPEDGFGTLTGDDLTDLSGYGVVFLNAVGTVRPAVSDVLGLGYSSDPELFLQLAALDGPDDTCGFTHEEMAALYESFDVQVWETPRDAPEEVTDPTLYLSGAWWSEHVQLDEGALLMLNVPGGWETAEALLDQGAGGVVSYRADQTVFPSASELFWGFSAMADFGVDLEASATGEIPWPCDLALSVSWLVEPEGQDPTCPPTARPSATGDGMGFPTWMTVGSVAHPAGTASVRTTIAYADASLPPPSPNVLEDAPGSPNTFEGLVPGAEVIVTSEALDAGGNVLGTTVEEATLAPGGCNDVVMRFSPPIQIMVDGASRDYPGGTPPIEERMHKFCATLQVLRGAEVRMDWSTLNEAWAYFPDVGFESGDTVRIVAAPVPDCADPEAEPPLNAPFLAPVYLHVWEGEDYENQVTVEVSAGQVSFDQTFTIERPAVIHAR